MSDDRPKAGPRPEEGAQRPKVGPTGKFLHDRGPHVRGDRGGINVAFVRVPEEVMPGRRHYVLNFGTQLDFMLATPAEAQRIAQAVRERIHQELGPDIPYDATGLPIGVSRTPTRMVSIKLPEPADVLMANVEVFLALAERLEAVAAECLG